MTFVTMAVVRQGSGQNLSNKSIDHFDNYIYQPHYRVILRIYHHNFQYLPKLFSGCTDALASKTTIIQTAAEYNNES